jgi:hypothetical protein
VAKVPLSVGCVKYKAQHVVLPVRIPVLIGRYERGAAKIRSLAVDFCCGARKWRGLLLSNKALFEGRLDGVATARGRDGADDVERGGKVGKEALNRRGRGVDRKGDFTCFSGVF